MSDAGDLTVNFADIFEFVADAVPEQLFLVAGDVRLTYAELDARADRAARLLRGAGAGPGDHVGLYAMNRAEWVEAMIACLKLRAVPVNVNFRYVAAELRHLLDDADLVSVVVERRYLPTLTDVLPDVSSVRSVVLEDGAPAGEGGEGGGATATGTGLAGYTLLAYEREPADTAPVRIPRSGDDQFIIYTGGTTGMPEGVIWRGEDMFFAGCRRPLPDGSIPEPLEEFLTRHVAAPPTRSFVLGPLMHGTAAMAILTAFTAAGTVVLWTGRRFDATLILTIAAAEQVNPIAMVGDAMAAPVLDAYDRGHDCYDLSALTVLVNSGTPLSEPTRDRIGELLPGVRIFNVFGGSETAHTGTETGGSRRSRTFRLAEDAAVLDDTDLRPVVPGSGAIGRIARRGRIPLGYYNDPVKTAATFRTDADGVRWVLPGDLATIAADGTAVLLGRANSVVNTGGEKVFPEEVENALTDHSAVADAVVVGAPDPRYGERVVALVAGYKVPREIHIVDTLTRTPTGKVDLRWAKQSAQQLSAEPAE